jgi:hypothetical protein
MLKKFFTITLILFNSLSQDAEPSEENQFYEFIFRLTKISACRGWQLHELF